MYCLLTLISVTWCSPVCLRHFWEGSPLLHLWQDPSRAQDMTTPSLLCVQQLVGTNQCVGVSVVDNCSVALTSPMFQKIYFQQRQWSCESEVAQSCPTLSDPMDCSPPGSSIHGIFQARVVEWGAIAFSGGHVYDGLNGLWTPKITADRAMLPMYS